MTAFLLLATAIVLICIGGMLGASWTSQVMTTVSRRHAAERKYLNNGWRDLAAAKQARGRALCPRCDRQLTNTDWFLVIDPPPHEEDDGT